MVEIADLELTLLLREALSFVKVRWKSGTDDGTSEAGIDPTAVHRPAPTGGVKELR